MAKRLLFLVISILLNTLGNALMIKVALGSAPWAAASLNTSRFFNISTGTALIALGIFALALTNILRKRLELVKDTFNFIYMMFYGCFVDLWLWTLSLLEVNIFAMRLVVCILGIALIGCAISIYFRVDLVIHPFDDLIKILKTDYLNGNVVKAQWITLGIALGISMIFGLINGEILGIHIGTILTYVLLGQFVSLFDKVWEDERLREKIDKIRTFISTQIRKIFKEKGNEADRQIAKKTSEFLETEVQGTSCNMTLQAITNQADITDELNQEPENTDPMKNTCCNSSKEM